MRVENAEEKKLDLTIIQRNAEKFEKKTENVEKNFEKKFEMREKKSDQIEKLRKDQWNVHEISKDAVMSINENNEIFKNNVMNIRSDHNVIKNVAVIVKIKNWKLRDATWTRNFRNKQIEKDAFDENTEISIERNITRVVNDRNQLFKNIVIVNKIDNKRLNRLVEVCLKFNKMIKNIDSAVFAAAKKISTDEKWNRIKKKNFETFDYFYNSKNA